ncbi:predicted protein [Postia placenta Mad-698-R]|nr:predicted protein [Postia placenta Mad-698-R]
MSRIAAALIVYEHILTSGDEIRLKWGYRRLIVAICFYLNRLTLLALGITGLLLVLPWKHKMRVSVEFSVDHGIAYCEGNFKLSTTEEDSYYCNTSMCDSVRCDGNPGDMEQHVQYRSLYFIALLLLNVIDMVTYYLNHLIGNLTAFILPLSSVLISRLLFNLRDATHRYEEGNTPSLACTISDTAYPSFDAERHAWHIKIEDAEQRYDSDDELFDDDEFMDDDATLCDTTRQRVCDPLNTV